MIEQVLIKKTLKAGSNVWLEGSIVSSPLPDVLIQEAEAKTGTVEVVKGDAGTKTKTIFVAKKVDERKKDVQVSSETSASTVPIPPPPPPTPVKENKPKPKLRRRK